ncbi:MAG: efflux RND transporter periplasmic adaptor subunit [Candidatus Saganbacteria bacterium]|nr:efflux RND transporter periplasmic adaptor subunit [Candidatus Saganbacteria bacterium]
MMTKRNILIAAVVLVVLVFGYFRLIKTEPSKMYRVGDLMLQVSVSPNPPRVGDGKVKIMIMDKNHKPITDAKVDVGYGMAAMGNMPAMYSEVRGQGIGDRYEADLSISMLGSWDLSLTIKLKNGETKRANFKFSTGQKGLIFYPDEDIAPMDMSSNAQLVKLTSKQIKLAQVRSMPLKRYSVFREIRAVGVVAYDPQLQVAEEEYLSALNDLSVVNLAAKKLRLLGISEKEIKRLHLTKKSDDALILPEDRAWVYANIYEYELSDVIEGQRVDVTTIAYPDKKFSGIIRGIVPVLDSKSRTQKIRIEIPKAYSLLRANMYVDVDFIIPQGNKYAIPKAALLETGKRKLVYIDKGAGYYERRSVRVGPLASILIDGEKQLVYPLISGVKKDEAVVVAANFLIDSQSELSGGMSGLYGSSAKEVKQEHKH